MQRIFHIHFLQVPKYIVHANLKIATGSGMISENSTCLCYNYPHKWHFLTLFSLELQIALGGKHSQKLFCCCRCFIFSSLKTSFLDMLL